MDELRAHRAVNAGEILQQSAGVKVQHGHKPADPDIGVCWLVSMLHFYSGTLLQNLSGVDSTMRAKLVHGTNSMS